MNTNPIYLDYAAATPMSPDVLEAMSVFWRDKFYNPSSIYSAAKDVNVAIDQARTTVARCIGSKPSEVIFTSGGTESTNLAINGILRRHEGASVLVSAVEHKAVMAPAQHYDHQVIQVHSNGAVDIDDFKSQVNDNTVLVSVMLANNEIGTLQPIKQLAKLIAEIRTTRQTKGINLPIYLHTDACQAPQYIDINVSKLGVDLMSLNGGKIYGPKSSGILYLRSGVEINPQLLGGGQEFGMRSGTEDAASIVGFASALNLVTSKRNSANKQVSELKQYLLRGLERIGAQVNGSKNLSLPSIVNVCFENTDNERVLFYLDSVGIYASSGSACSASSGEPSTVLSAIGLTDDQARASLRFSISPKTTKSEIDTLLMHLPAALKA